jgi:membrane-associated phospholipid phosphatase
MLRSPAAVAVALGSALATAVVWAVAFQTAAGARLDAAVLDGFTGFRDSRLEPLASLAVSLADPLPYAVMALLIAMLAVARGRPRHALLVIAVAVAAPVTTEMLKPLATVRRPAPTPEFAPAVDGWPSGHMTAAMTLALCLVLVAPARLRPSAAALGGLFAVAEGYGVLVLGWHYPSDVVGACAIATGWLALGVAVAGVVRERPTAGVPRPLLWPAALTAMAIAAFAAGIAIARPAGSVDYVEYHTTFVAAAAALGLMALGVVAMTAAALTLIERRRRLREAAAARIGTTADAPG